MKNRFFRRAFNALAAWSVSIIALGAGSAQANDVYAPLQLVDMTTQMAIGGDMLITTGFLHELDFVAFVEPTMSVAPDGIIFEQGVPEAESGWSGLIEIDLEDDPSLPIQQVSAFSDTFAEGERETKMSGFYTMRYQFETDMPFRPYAGAGLGLVASETSTDMTGVVAGRAMAGFDLAVNDNSAIFAEYAYVKNGGVSLGMGVAGGGSALPDDEHSLKFGFRRTF